MNQNYNKNLSAKNGFAIILPLSTRRKDKKLRVLRDLRGGKLLLWYLRISPKYVIASLLTLLLISFTVSVYAQLKEPGLDDYLYARKLYDEKYYDLAAEQLERILRDYPDISEAQQALHLLGESYTFLEQFDEARSAFLKVAIVYPKSPQAPEAMFKVAVCLEKLERFVEAAQAFERIQGFYPRDPLALVGLNSAANIYSSLGDTVRSDAISEQLIEKYPESQAADDARMNKAYRLISHSDLITARLYLQRISERVTRPELASSAMYELAKLMRQNWELDESQATLEKAYREYPDTKGGLYSQLELGDLLTFRGLTDQSIELLTPLLKSNDDSIRSVSSIRIGDAHYRNRDYNKALSYYDSGSLLSRAQLKAAWTSEKLGLMEKALDRYLKLSTDSNEDIYYAIVRAATISQQLNRYEKAATLWSDLSNIEPTDRIIYELSKSLFSGNLPGIKEAADNFLNKYPSSPWADEILYLSASTEARDGNYKNAIALWSKLISSYPASPLADSSSLAINFTTRYRIKGDDLVEKMAELSSNPSTDPIDKATAWGDFYLEEFRDPIKAIDQYAYTTNSIVPTTEEYSYALLKSGQAYLLLYEAAIREDDQFAVQMYRDSTLSRLTLLDSLSSYSGELELLATEFVKVEFSYNSDLTENYSVDSKVSDMLLSRFDVENVSPPVVALILDREINSGDYSSSVEAHEILEQIEAVLKQRLGDDPVDDQTTAKLKYLRSIELIYTGQVKASTDSMLELWEQHPNTISAAQAGKDLFINDSLSFTRRLEILDQFEQRYPYLIEEEYHQRIKSRFLDSLDRPLEALTALHQAEDYRKWDQPGLDILNLPDEQSRYKQAQALFRGGQFERASEQFRILLNLNPKGVYASSVLWMLAQLHNQQGKIGTALAYLDTLQDRSPQSLPNSQAYHLRPELLMKMHRYEDAQVALKELIKITDNPDSLYHYRMQEMVTLYRQNLLRKNRQPLKEFYDQFKEREDIDHAKALFYLEKGRTLDRTGKHEEAREQYNTVLEKYPLTEWIDDAAYAEPLSFISEEKFEAGITGLKRFLENYPESNHISNAQLSLGLVLYQNEQYPEAVAMLRKIWENEETPHMWMRTFEALLKVYQDMRFYDAAIRLLRDYIERYPNAHDVLDRKMDIGQFYLQLGQWDETVRYYKPLIEIADAEREAEMQFYIGEAYYNKKDYRTAILEYLKVKILGRKTKLDWGVTALYQIALCYEELEEYDGAARMYKQIIKERGEASNYGRAALKKLNQLSIRK